MLKGKTKELIICILAIAFLVLALTTNVFADDIGGLNNIINDSNQNNDYAQIQNRNVNNSNGGLNANNNINNSNVNGVNNSNKNANNNANSNKSAIPYAGVDYSVIAVITVCGISAIYAYKKIREYKSL